MGEPTAIMQQLLQNQSGREQYANELTRASREADLSIDDLVKQVGAVLKFAAEFVTDHIRRVHNPESYAPPPPVASVVVFNKSNGKSLELSLREPSSSVTSARGGDDREQSSMFVDPVDLASSTQPNPQSPAGVGRRTGRSHAELLASAKARSEARRQGLVCVTSTLSVQCRFYHAVKCHASSATYRHTTAPFAPNRRR